VTLEEEKSMEHSLLVTTAVIADTCSAAHNSMRVYNMQYLSGIPEDQAGGGHTQVGTFSNASRGRC
jgi:hypothetical protein